MANVAGLQAEMLQDVLKSRRELWADLLKGCQPTIEQFAKAPVLTKFLGSRLSGPHLVLSMAGDLKTANKQEPVESKKKQFVVSNGMEIEGTPLEAPFSEEELDLLSMTKFTALNPLEKFSPLPINFAQNAQMWYLMALGALCKEQGLKPEEMVPLLIICRGDDFKKEATQVPCPTPSNLMLTGLAHNTAIFAHHLGKLGLDDMKTARTNALNALGHITSAALKVEYLQQTVQLGKILSSSIDDHDCFLIRMTWTNPKNINADIPLTQDMSRSNASIEITLQDNFNWWLCGKIWEDLHLLQDLARLVEQVNPDPDTILSAVSGDPPAQSVEQLMDMSSSFVEGDEGTDTTSLVNLFNIVNEGRRPNLDFSEALWNSYKYSCEIGYIAKGIENALKNCINRNVEVSSSNTTKIAQLAKQLFETKEANLIQTPTTKETLLYMLEIGFLKLQRDFAYIAQNSHLALSLMITKALSCADWSEKLKQMTQVLQAFEVTLRAQKWLHLEQEALQKLFCSSLTVPNLEKINVTLPSHCLTHIIQCFPPVVRSWCFEVSKGSTTLYHTFTASQYSIFSWADVGHELNDSILDPRPDSSKVLLNCAILKEQLRGGK